MKVEKPRMKLGVEKHQLNDENSTWGNDVENVVTKSNVRKNKENQNTNRL